MFLFLWVVTFLLYLPAYDAGKSGDYYMEWVRRVQEHDTWYCLTAPYGDSLYYSILMFMILCYKCFGLSAWAGHLLAITSHVAAATTLYLILRKLFIASALKNALFMSLGTALFFCISPYNTEIIVHEHCYAYTISFLLPLLTVHLTQNFILTQRAVYAWLAGAIFFISCYGMEIFYIVPCLCCTLLLYHFFILKCDQKILRKTILYIIIPQVVIFSVYLLLLHKITGHFFAHRVNEKMDHIRYYLLSTSPKRLFYAAFMGRFFPEQTRDAVNTFFDSPYGMCSFGAFIGVLTIYVLVQFRKFGPSSKVVVLLCLWVMAGLFITATSFFPYTGYVSYDRYIYMTQPFIFAILFILINDLSSPLLKYALITCYGSISACCLLMVNNQWRLSSNVINSLMAKFPVRNDGRVILLLNVPNDLNSILMIGARPMEFYDPWSSFKLTYNYEHTTKITDPVCDIAAFSMKKVSDGAHVRVMNDSVLDVTLNEKQRKWMQYFNTAHSIDNYVYHMDMTDTNAMYRLTLKHPAERYVILYTVGSQWKEVNMNYREGDQF
ncbi:MAG: hypothetical protein JWQ38_2988 [Flavipsychrobacter sp.]|nr:hypothetical protein [Flavipsychrobacter sp.]